MSESMEIYCCGCKSKVTAELVDGSVVYPHRPDLADLPFWKCGACGNFVGCHHKTKQRTRPLGCIPTPEIKRARQEIHKILDPLWNSGRMRRKDIYSALSQELGWKYHTANILDIDEARKIYRIVRQIAQSQEAGK